MKILLINPPIREWAKPSIFPSGLAYIAKVLLLAGHKVEVLDINAHRWPKEVVEEKIRAADFNTNYDTASEDYPWKSRRIESLVYDVLTFFIPLAIPGNMHRGTLTNISKKIQSSKLKMFIMIGSFLARMRIKFSFFRLPFEKLIFSMYCSVRKIQRYQPGGKTIE
jgi:hypothetical protein